MEGKFWIDQCQCGVWIWNSMRLFLAAPPSTVQTSKGQPWLKAGSLAKMRERRLGWDWVMVFS